jgi:hypothetical protein
MSWTKQHPTEDGFYWYRDLPGAKPEIMERASDCFWANGNDCMMGTEWRPLEGEFWSERIQPPQTNCKCWFSLNTGPNGECEKCGLIPDRK